MNQPRINHFDQPGCNLIGRKTARNNSAWMSCSNEPLSPTRRRAGASLLALWRSLASNALCRNRTRRRCAPQFDTRPRGAAAPSIVLGASVVWLLPCSSARLPPRVVYRRAPPLLPMSGLLWRPVAAEQAEASPPSKSAAKRPSVCDLAVHDLAKTGRGDRHRQWVTQPFGASSKDGAPLQRSPVSLRRSPHLLRAASHAFFAAASSCSPYMST
jgi:hypothetical protein